MTEKKSMDLTYQEVIGLAYILLHSSSEGAFEDFLTLCQNLLRRRRTLSWGTIPSSNACIIVDDLVNHFSAGLFATGDGAAQLCNVGRDIFLSVVGGLPGAIETENQSSHGADWLGLLMIVELYVLA